MIIVTLSEINALWVLLGIVVIVAMATIVLLSKRKEETLSIETKRADASTNLVRIRDTEIDDLKKQICELESELADIKSEYKTLVGINIKVLMDYWQVREDEMAETGRLLQQLRVLKRRIGDDETNIHGTQG